MAILDKIKCRLGKHDWAYDHDDFWTVAVFKCQRCGETVGRDRDIREPQTGAEIYTRWEGGRGLVTYSVYGDEVGSLTFVQRNGTFHVGAIHVRYEYRRQGIATRMVYEAMRLTGSDEAKTDLITEEGSALVRSLPELKLRIVG